MGYGIIIFLPCLNYFIKIIATTFLLRPIFMRNFSLVFIIFTRDILCPRKKINHEPLVCKYNFASLFLHIVRALRALCFYVQNERKRTIPEVFLDSMFIHRVVWKFGYNLKFRNLKTNLWALCPFPLCSET